MSDQIDKEIRIASITRTAKLSSLFFASIAFLQYYLTGKDVSSGLTDFFGIVIAVMLILLALFTVWSILDKRSANKQLLVKWIHPIILINISFVSIMLTGAHESNYKFLFLFIIISSSIECGTKVGMIIATISSAIVLGVDLLTAPHTTVNSYFESDLLLASAFLIIAWTIGFYSKIEKEHISTLRDLVNIDGLTGLYNHRYFYDVLTEKVKECREKNGCLALLFIDIDYFKVYNDLYGHQKGDEALKTIATKMKEVLRKDDIVSRYGGEEFSVILQDTYENEALEIAERLRRVIHEHYFQGEENMPNKSLTISVGVSLFPSKAESEVELIRSADEALYKAKFLRKNRVESYYSFLDDLQKKADENDKEVITSIKTLIAVINAKDKYTYLHSERVVYYCLLVADKLGFDESTKKDFVYAGYMHDIGKINIPEEILSKTSPLTKEEWDIIKEHPKRGAEIIEKVSVLKNVAPLVLQHHERYDGRGYPGGLKAGEVSFLSSLITVIDSFDAMTSVPSVSEQEILLKGRGGTGALQRNAI